MRRAVVVAILSLVVAAALVAGGRWERSQAADSQNAKMHSVYEAVGGSLTGRRITGYRYGDPNCLAYEEPPVVFALQLCFDAQGRLVETVDRRYGKPRYASLMWQPSLATFRVPPRRVLALMKQASAPPHKERSAKAPA